MLVLTRKLNEQIQIGDDVTITVLRVKGNTIRLGIEAPRSTRVVRGELPPLEAPPAGGPAAALKLPAPNAGAATLADDDQERPQRPHNISPLGAYVAAQRNGVSAQLSV